MVILSIFYPGIILIRAYEHTVWDREFWADSTSITRSAGCLVHVPLHESTIVVAVMVVARVPVVDRQTSVGASCRPLLALGAGGIVRGHNGSCVVG